jgi:hypothetical protein
MYSRPIKHATVLQCESRAVPWTLNAVAHKIAFRERPAEMRTSLGQGKDPSSTADEQDWNTIVFDALGLSVCEIGFGQHGDKVGRKGLTGGAINAHSVLVNHIPAQTGRGGHHAKPQHAQDPTHFP